MIEPRSRGVLDAPPEPVIGLAEGETRWRGMTTLDGYGRLRSRGSLLILGLTKTPGGTSFVPFRGHLSRPACSHVKQLAKQAGDRSDPGRTFVQAGFFYGLISV